MSSMEIGAAMFAGVIVLLVLRVPVAIAMLLAGGLGYAAITGWWPLLNTLKSMTFSKFSSYTLSIIPLFVLMGEFATRGGLNASLYQAARGWLGHRKGGLAMATIGGCAAFGALCGSSLATAATMSQVAGPEMRRHGYSGALSTGTLAAGGTLGILIPPSVILVIYAIYTEQSIGALFVAAIVPAILAILGYLAVVAIYARIWPSEAPSAERFGWERRIALTRKVAPAAIVFVVVVGGIYGGWFSPTAAAAVGAVSVAANSAVAKRMRWEGFRAAILGTATTTALVTSSSSAPNSSGRPRPVADCRRNSPKITALDLPPSRIARDTTPHLVSLFLGCAL